MYVCFYPEPEMKTYSRYYSTWGMQMAFIALHKARPIHIHSPPIPRISQSWTHITNYPYFIWKRRSFSPNRFNKFNSLYVGNLNHSFGRHSFFLLFTPSPLLRSYLKLDAFLAFLPFHKAAALPPPPPPAPRLVSLNNLSGYQATFFHRTYSYSI